MLNVVIIVHFIPESVLLPEPVLLRPGLSPAIHTLFRRPADRAPEWLLEEPPISVRACTRQEESPIPPNLGVAQQPRDREARLLDVTAGNVASRPVPPPARDPTQPSRRAPGRMCLCGPASSAIDIVATSVWAESGFRCPGEAETEGPTMRGEARARGAPLALSGVRVAAICWSGGFRSASSSDLLWDATPPSLRVEKQNTAASRMWWTRHWSRRVLGPTLTPNRRRAAQQPQDWIGRLSWQVQEELHLMLTQDDRVAVNMLLLQLQAWNQDRVTQTERAESRTGKPD